MSDHDHDTGLGLGDINDLANAAGGTAGVSGENASADGPGDAAPTPPAEPKTQRPAVAKKLPAAPAVDPEESKRLARLAEIRKELAEIGDPMAARRAAAARRCALVQEQEGLGQHLRVEIGTASAEEMQAQEDGQKLLERRRLLGVEAAKLGDPKVLDAFPLGGKELPEPQLDEDLTADLLERIEDDVDAWWETLTFAEKMLLVAHERRRRAPAPASAAA